ncbi:hypothetical protein bpr_I0021 [Butyrivibrio proteoclasticus B316]|jgi:hypothetical protein|uniref:YolD-like protein n=1 Tax=Butyrivibrio proteoclasticus (strain ATCC 51982 / DSM 14932 / B316) TaxID=515622 RepID=E0S2F0_BUTPB|nr:hypothetical protein [Butyrivibrio proteoclasticus]ADL32773.1 hypothetical protein bpr_I0021 [Butyrivibrio proteoclasticus B316]
MSIDKYKDMIYMDRPISKKHTPMPLENRAAQFAPFAALTGYDDAVNETSRLTVNKIELSEEKKAELDLTLSNLNSVITTNPKASITYFVPDSLKAGGDYVTVNASIRKIDSVSRTIILMDRSVIAIDDIISIEPEDGDV